MPVQDMVKRRMGKGERDFIPTPPYATRALFKHVAPDLVRAAPSLSAWDPAAGHGHMLRVLREVGYETVHGTDITPHEGEGISELDFTKATERADCIITNPPYNLLNDFILHGLDQADVSLSLLVRVQALEGQRRYEAIFKDRPPSQIAFFSDRIPFKKGVVVPKAPKMFFHVWLHWNIEAIRKKWNHQNPPMWIPPNVQKTLQKPEDYQ